MKTTNLIIQSRLARTALVLALFFSAAVGSASAGTIGISGTTLIFGADADEQLALSGSTSATDLFLEGASFDIVTPGCVAEGAGVRCALSGFSALTIIGSDLDDVIALNSVFGLSAFIATKGGDDVVVGGRANDVITGGSGDDVLVGNGGIDRIFGGSGANILLGGGPSGIEPPDPTPLPHLTPIPEPTTMSLVGLGLVGMIARRKRRRLDPQ